MFDVASESIGGVDWQVTDGLTDYLHASAAMTTRAQQIRAGTARELVWLLEHPPVFTAGTSSRMGDLRNPRHFPVHWTTRGGQWTYHGPGQRVVYVMLDLSRPHGSIRCRDIRAYVSGLEDWVIRAVARFGVRGERRDGRVGVWVVERSTPSREAKIAAIGVRISRWVTWHGLALNVAPDLSHFAGIVPCGIREHGVTSLAELGVNATMDDVDSALRATWSSVFGGAI
jgi:lipoyl(octanoyl) transferase